MDPPLAPTTRAKPRLRWIWPLAVAALIAFASSRSHVAAPHIPNSDKVAHFLAFGLLATLMCRLGHRGRAAGWALLVTSAFGVSDEWHQSFVPGRTCDVFDWMADTLGATVAVGLYVGWPWYRTLLERAVWSHAQKNET